MSCTPTTPTADPSKHGVTGSRGAPVIWFAAATLLGSFLIFQVQPVISKCVLPWFGGTPAVWTTCMLFFQLLLFAGYLYAHVLRTYLPAAMQGAVHLVLLAVAALMLPIEPTDAWKPIGSESPVGYLLSMLAVHVGLPYFMLSSTGPLVQAWLSEREPGERVYRLYALSNIGSLVALISYPFAVEPLMSVSIQSTVWSLLFCAFVLVQGFVAVGLLRSWHPTTWRVGPSEKKQDAEDRANVLAHPSRAQQFGWIGLPAFASTMLLVVTNHVCQDVAVIPFLWVLPLSLYLASFIVCFDSPQWYKPKWIAAVTLLAVVLIQLGLRLPSPWRLLTEASGYMVLLTGVCLLCHGEVVRIKPATRLLTRFYASISAGGALGGITVAIVCPLSFSDYVELPIMLAVTAAGCFLVFFACRCWGEAAFDWHQARRLRFGAVALLVSPLIALVLAPTDETIASQRNFFGVLQVTRSEQGTQLVHGSTIHGIQRNGEFAAEPTSYYGRKSGIGRAVAAMQRIRPELRVGVIGLGCGVLAAYGRPEDQFDLVEINPAIVQIAKQHFTFLRDCPSQTRVHLGDGRLVLERMQAASFDILVLDAFSSDAIPAHLLTREAMQLYRSRLAVGGILAIHVSNNHLNLVPLTHNLTRDAGMISRDLQTPGDPLAATKPANWVLATHSDQHPLWRDESMRAARQWNASRLRTAPLWTDQHHNLLSVLKLW